MTVSKKSFLFRFPKAFLMKAQLLLFLTKCFCVSGQTISIDPAVAGPAQPVTVTFDVSGTDFALRDLDDVWLWAWLENGDTDVNAPTNVNPATSAQDPARVTRSSSHPDLYSITITPTKFFDRPASEIREVGVLLKGRDWSDGQTADRFITFSESFAMGFASPAQPLMFTEPGESIEIIVNTNEPAAIVIRDRDNILASAVSDVTELSHTLVVPEGAGAVTILAEASNGVESKTDSFTYVVRTQTVLQSRPAGMVDGINYSTDATKITLGLWAPGKTSVYVFGDFTGWKINPDFQMKQDGEHFWLEIEGLTAGEEYAFQYLVDESVRIADPYADKILDPDDPHIPDTAYPNLKPFPKGALSDQWYFNRVAILRTGQHSYAWATENFQKPEKKDLVIYELLIRDFFGDGERNYQNLIDTLTYLKRLGVNAIELMPIMEFNGNESWGYNPAFMFAPDKYYGTKEKLKEFIDKCHGNGMAVILDIVMNHHDLPNPYLMLDFDFVNGKPEADNKWFNREATHPFNVFFDMNHESEYTQKYLDTVNYYWLKEYKVDGFRFDLSKGFTQTSNPLDADAWSAHDPSRIAILKRMADRIWQHTPDAYIILEHLAANTEEKELAEYRANEGKGMMLWGKMTDPFNQLTMGYAENSDITGILHGARGWTVPHLIGYMESHDEERLMVKNIMFGNATTDYSVKDTLTALSRMRAASTLFYTIPGPKMLWQFGELGYDYSINYCPDGSLNDGCRVSPKPVRWDYKTMSFRYSLYDHIRDLIRMRTEYDLFTRGNATIMEDGLLKQIVLKNDPYTSSPAGPDEMNAVVIANFDVVPHDMHVEFPHDGTWYDYYHGGTVDVAGSSVTMTIIPGGYSIFTDVAVKSSIITGMVENFTDRISLYPNPARDRISIMFRHGGVEARHALPLHISLYTNHGRYIPLPKRDDDAWDISFLPPGLYLLEIKGNGKISRRKLIKR